MGIDYMFPSLLFIGMILGACFDLGQFALNRGIDTTIRGSFWEVKFSQGGGRDLEETSQGRFPDQNR